MTLTPRSPKLEADSSSDLDGWHWADPPGEPPHADSQPPDTAVTNSAAAPPTVATDSQLSQFIFLVDYSRPTLMPGNNAIHTEPGDDNGSEKCDNASANFSQNCSKDSDQNSTGNAGGVWLNDSNLTAGGAFSLTYGVSTTVPVGPGSTSSFSGREHLSIQSEARRFAKCITRHLGGSEEYFFTKGFMILSFLLVAVFSYSCWRQRSARAALVPGDMQLSSLSEWIGGEDDDDIPIAGPLSGRARLPPLSISQPGHADYYDMSTPRLEGRHPGR
eukprot:s176_g6.t1